MYIIIPKNIIVTYEYESEDPAWAKKYYEELFCMKSM